VRARICDPDLLSKVDAVLLESVDGRPHLGDVGYDPDYIGVVILLWVAWILARPFLWCAARTFTNGDPELDSD